MSHRRVLISPFYNKLAEEVGIIPTNRKTLKINERFRRWVWQDYRISVTADKHQVFDSAHFSTFCALREVSFLFGRKLLVFESKVYAQISGFTDWHGFLENFFVMS